MESFASQTLASVKPRLVRPAHMKIVNPYTEAVMFGSTTVVVGLTAGYRSCSRDLLSVPLTRHHNHHEQVRHPDSAVVEDKKDSGQAAI